MLDPTTWTEKETADPVFADNHIPYLCNVMGVQNERMYVDAFRDFVLSGAKMNQVTSNLLNLVNTIPINLAECERSLRAKNGILTKDRASLLIPTISSLILIYTAGPPLEYFNSILYMRIWLRKGHHSKAVLTQTPKAVSGTDHSKSPIKDLRRILGMAKPVLMRPL